MRRIVLGVAMALVLLALLAEVAAADNGPHGNYGKTTSACAACHRAHTAQGANLLVASSTYNLCITCHGASGSGANTNVLQGVYENARVTAYSGQGTNGAGLLGGGFQSTLMNTDWGAGPTSRPVTSSHVVDGSLAGTVWGFGPISATANSGLPNVTLDCANCHNPHGNSGSNGQATYRILRTQPLIDGQTLATYADVADLAGKSYTISQTDGAYMGQYYDGYNTNLSKWCAQCHTRYLAGGSAMETASGDALFNYRHKSDTNGAACLSCHVSHGSSAQMSGFADLHAVTPGVGTTGTDSALLRLDNRGVCVYCH